MKDLCVHVCVWGGGEGGNHGMQISKPFLKSEVGSTLLIVCFNLLSHLCDLTIQVLNFAPGSWNVLDKLTQNINVHNICTDLKQSGQRYYFKCKTTRPQNLTVSLKLMFTFL